ncbi:hypothetical protein [Pontibacter ummariensis]|nr:hypothetical protein [Pontibacter ummariensis]
MKTFVYRLLAVGLLLCQVLTSCYSYRNTTRSGELSPPELASQFKPGKLYKVTSSSGDETKIRVTGMDDTYLYGTIYTLDYAGNTMKAPDSAVPLDQIVKVKEKKLNVLLTIGVVVVPVALSFYIVSETCCDFNPFPNGL